jgi:hypothetical protein
LTAAEPASRALLLMLGEVDAATRLPCPQHLSAYGKKTN